MHISKMKKYQEFLITSEGIGNTNDSNYGFKLLIVPLEHCKVGFWLPIFVPLYFNIQLVKLLQFYSHQIFVIKGKL